ncbi:MAG: hypothetical protein ACYTFT_16095 [Planctomycetota bacterium]|jgi:hypothetical protein
MLPVYVGSLIFGGGLVAVSVLGGDGDSDVDADMDMDMDMDVDADLDFDADVDVDLDMDADLDADTGGLSGAADAAHGIGLSAALWMPLLSLRFWIFAIAFFGLTGTVFSVLGVNALATLILAISIGVVSGFTVSKLVASLRRDHVSGDVDPGRDFVARSGDVLLDVAQGRPGQVRLDVKGVFLDVQAELLDPDGEPIKRGERVLVYATRGSSVLVLPLSGGRPAATLGSDDLASLAPTELAQVKRVTRALSKARAST